MLISFSVENWQSFREKATLSLVAGREKQHRESLAKVKGYKLDLLPIAAIYGANASGKTKLFNALKFAKKFVTRVTQPESSIYREHFKLDKESALKPSKFQFEILAEDKCYEFSFSVTEKRVVEEKLVNVSSSSEKVLYQRDAEGKFLFSGDKKLKKDQRLQFVAEGTRDNQLFLTNSVDQKIDYFLPIYNWFKNTLTLISPDAHFWGSADSISQAMSNALAKLDTGITRLGEETIPFEALPYPEKIKTHLLENLAEGEQAGIEDLEERIFLTKKNGEIVAKKLIPYHKSADGEDIALEFKDLSSGTLRIIDLSPAFADLSTHDSSRVYFIDELDRCLHGLVTRNFIKTYLKSCSAENRSQLIFTTHDVLLMDQNLLRRDEIWVTEKDQKGCSTLYSFADFKDVRADKDIRKSYLQGRLGGVPKILWWGKDGEG